MIRSTKKSHIFFECRERTKVWVEFRRQGTCLFPVSITYYLEPAVLIPTPVRNPRISCLRSCADKPTPSVSFPITSRNWLPWVRPGDFTFGSGFCKTCAFRPSFLPTCRSRCSLYRAPGTMPEARYGQDYDQTLLHPADCERHIGPVLRDGL